MRITWFLLGIVLIVLLTGCSELSKKEISEMQCADLIPEIIDLSEDNDNPLAPTILKIYDVEELERTSQRIDCEGDAKWSTGEWRVAFHIEEDGDGDRFIGYQLKLFQ